MTRGWPVYRCRFCAEETIHEDTPPMGDVRDFLERGANSTRVHECSDGHLGVAELVGMKLAPVASGKEAA